MCWIKDLRDEMGDKVVVAEVNGHLHWGFKVGDVYEIVDNLRGHPAFRGDFGEGGTQTLAPAMNYAWVFKPALPISLENK